jgi:hypothetical protein
VLQVGVAKLHDLQVKLKEQRTDVKGEKDTFTFGIH